MRLAYAATELQRERRAWRTPDVLPMRRWLEREALRAADAGKSFPRPLRPAEEWFLWREAAKEVARSSELGASDGLAQALRLSAGRLSDWRIPVSQLRGAGAHESEWLLRALEHVEARARASGAAARHQLGALLQSWIPSRAVSFAGFTELTALQRALVQASREWSPGEPPGSAYRACARNPAEELELAAQWCRSRLGADPQLRLLVIVPDLPRRRAEVVRVFGEVLDPRSLLGALGARGLTLEGGEPLARYPLVRHAVVALRLLTGTLDFEVLSAWLRSSFWRAPQDAERAQLDTWLRRRLGIEVSAPELGVALESAPGELGMAARTLASAVQAAARRLEPAQEPVPIPQWARRFEQALTTLGWPGAHPLGSAELQTKARFAELLADLVALGVHGGPVRATEALLLLEALAERTVFAPATGDAAVTLTGALVDPVVRYDGIWVAGLHAEAWPPPAEIDPFIPLAAQRGAGMPGLTALAMLARARNLLARWQHCAPELIVSWSAHDDDRVHLASPLLAELPGVQGWSPPQDRLRLVDHIRRARRIEWFDDPVGDPWPADAPLPGGARALENQGRCPFRAYAELRLSSAPLETPRPGIDPRERGRFLHRALELMWRRLGDSAALAEAARGGRLERLIEACVARAAEEIWPVGRTAFAAAPATTQGEHAGIESAQRRERRRAVRLLSRLAALERERSGFRVAALEIRRPLELAGATLGLRIDRIDELQDGARVVLDYKTSRPPLADWLGERISDPQLLAYLLTEGERVAALATVQLTAERIGYRGVSDRPGRLPHVAPLGSESAWLAQVGRWRAALEQLAHGFLAGSAAVDPVEHACRICHLHALCRIGDRGQSPAPEDSHTEAADADAR